MSIKKPLGLGLVIGLLAMAFAALPAVASAAPQLTSPAGTTVKVGATLTATSTNAKTVFPGLGTLECAKVVVNGNVITNSGTEVLVEMDGANDTATGCTLNGSAVSVSPTLTSIKLTASSKTASFDFTGGGLSESSTSTVTYTPPATKVHIEGPVTGTVAGTFSGDFTAVVASTGKAVIFD